MADVFDLSVIKPTTQNFAKFRKVAITRLIEHHQVSVQKSRTFSMLLEIIERYRIQFSKGDYKFQTKRVSNSTLATELGVGVRYLQTLMVTLVQAGIIRVLRRKVGVRMNLWNAYELVGFREWPSRFAQANRTPVHPKEDNDIKSLSQPKTRHVCFPKTPINCGERSTRFWRVLALEESDKLPDLRELSTKFRIHLIKRSIPFDDPSIIGRWKSFVRIAVGWRNGSEAS